MFFLTEKNAIKAMTEVIKEIYKHKPTSLRIVLEGSVDDIPTIHVEYDTFVYDKVVGEQYGEQ